MRIVSYTAIAVLVVVVAEFMREQLTNRPVQPDASGIEYNTATWDNSNYATSEANAYGAFQPQAPAVPNTPYGWETFESVNNGGIVPPNSGMSNYST